MMRALGALARPVLWRLPPEIAHRASIAALKFAPLPRPRPPDPRLATSVFGLEFPNPLGLAAGFDKNAEVVGALLALGFGHVEAGTLTPRPQAGAPRPRMFRLKADGALVNRCGFNNQGYEAARARLAASKVGGVVGVNIGPNKDAADRLADFALGVKTFAPFASYLAINVSSPNTPALRDLQRRDALDELAARVVEARDEAAPRRPVLIKIAPDLDLRGLDDVVAVCTARGIDGLIVANTTTARPPSLRDAHAREAGGLSGRPLFAPSTRMLARAFLRCEGALPLIGCGGVEDAESALAKIEAGASLVQIYTGMIYRGPEVIDEILDGLSRALAARGAASLADLVGVGAREWAATKG
ncbi:MAG: quinone-dependent dihydroorotate dehydrogenase [Roseiarcus sp.]|jgi:dihydroorotate dehydrogenase